jgi:hypothetical protein
MAPGTWRSKPSGPAIDNPVTPAAMIASAASCHGSTEATAGFALRIESGHIEGLLSFA